MAFLAADPKADAIDRRIAVGTPTEIGLRVLVPWPLKLGFDHIIVDAPIGGLLGAMLGDTHATIVLLTLSALAPGESTLATVAWDATGQGGEHDLHAMVDPDDSVAEFDEANNGNQALIALRGLGLQVITGQTSYEVGEGVTTWCSLTNLKASTLWP